MLISDIWPVEQIQQWKRDYNYDAKDRVSRVYEIILKQTIQIRHTDIC